MRFNKEHDFFLHLETLNTELLLPSWNILIYPAAGPGPRGALLPSQEQCLGGSYGSQNINNSRI